MLQGLASLIDDFHKRKQRLLFYKPRAAVLSVLNGVGLEDFIHVNSQEQLDCLLKGWFHFNDFYELEFLFLVCEIIDAFLIQFVADVTNAMGGKFNDVELHDVTALHHKEKEAEENSTPLLPEPNLHLA